MRTGGGAGPRVGECECRPVRSSDSGRCRQSRYQKVDSVTSGTPSGPGGNRPSFASRWSAKPTSRTGSRPRTMRSTQNIFEIRRDADVRFIKEFRLHPPVHLRRAMSVRTAVHPRSHGQFLRGFGVSVRRRRRCRRDVRRPSELPGGIPVSAFVERRYQRAESWYKFQPAISAVQLLTRAA